MPLSRKCFSTALWVAFIGCWAATIVNAKVARVIAASAGAIGVTAMICGTLLAVRVPVAASRGLVSKPVTKPDGLDVDSCLGWIPAQWEASWSVEAWHSRRGRNP